MGRGLTRRAAVAAIAVACAAACATPASAAGLLSTTVTAADASARSCIARPLERRGRGRPRGHRTRRGMGHRAAERPLRRLGPRGLRRRHRPAGHRVGLLRCRRGGQGHSDGRPASGGSGLPPHRNVRARRPGRELRRDRPEGQGHEVLAREGLDAQRETQAGADRARPRPHRARREGLRRGRPPRGGRRPCAAQGRIRLHHPDRRPRQADRGERQGRPPLLGPGAQVGPARAGATATGCPRTTRPT